jgi:uncharacterized membrane protein YfcA
VEQSIFFFIAVGFVAQMVDGSLGMAYGVSANTLLLSLGIPPAAASASVHASEVATTGVSGYFHLRYGNVRKDLFLRLLLPGITGGVLGAFLLTSIPGDTIKPFINAYLLLMGLIILVRSFMQVGVEDSASRIVPPLGFLGGFLDAIGGGGWGPVVTTTLIARGNQPRSTIGSVNAAEFFITLAETVVFSLTIQLTHWRIILGLLIGGALAAPLAARLTRKLPTRWLMAFVGALIALISARSLLALIV